MIDYITNDDKLARAYPARVTARGVYTATGQFIPNDRIIR